MEKELDHTISSSEKTLSLGLPDRSPESGKGSVDRRPQGWPPRPVAFPDLMTPIEAAMFLRLDETEHSPRSACRTLNYWRDRGDLKATKYARRVWFLREELERFLKKKTEET